MIKTLTYIIESIKSGKSVSQKDLDTLVRNRNREMHDGKRTVAKKRLMSAYLKERASKSAIWESWDIDEDTHLKIVATLRAKPRRTASGVATITVLTKPWPCGSDCIYCPNDIRMPKSYMSDEPACQRAERNFFDPYLQVVSRMQVLEDMGHSTDKVELIVLGGTWSDYPRDYRIWFTKRLFEALNEFEDIKDGKPAHNPICNELRSHYERSGLTSCADALKERASELQAKVDNGAISYNDAIRKMPMYGFAPENSSFDISGDEDADATQSPTGVDTAISALEDQQHKNETSAHRVVGLVFETRPDAICEDELIFLRQLGATKVQMGIQSLDDDILAANRRPISVDRIAEAFALIRLFGFKTHIHLMVNLVGATPESDIAQYEKLVSDDRFKPDEVKLYPCALVQSAHLTTLFDEGKWHPYTEEELLDVLAHDILITPAYTRISRMIRDISATDILVGNKKTNLRQMVEQRAQSSGSTIDEMRMREIATDNIDDASLEMKVISYSTSCTEEHFLEWVTQDGKLAAFLRLSLPRTSAIDSLSHSDVLADAQSYAMIREVHVYGKVSRLHESKEGAQHLGLGRALVEEACKMAKSYGYSHVNVISSVGTREYYRKLGFADRGLYQTKTLV